MRGSNSHRLIGLTKLSDANLAATKHGQDCTLILTEGESAKALAIAGLAVVGRDNFGVFPLRGKLLNVREAKHDQILKNEEIQSIRQIMGAFGFFTLVLTVAERCLQVFNITRNTCLPKILDMARL